MYRLVHVAWISGPFKINLLIFLCSGRNAETKVSRQVQVRKIISVEIVGSEERKFKCRYTQIAAFVSTSPNFVTLNQVPISNQDTKGHTGSKLPREWFY